MIMTNDDGLRVTDQVPREVTTFQKAANDDFPAN